MTKSIGLSVQDLEAIQTIIEEVAEKIGDDPTSWDSSGWRWGVTVEVESMGYSLGVISVHPDGWWQFHQKTEN